jgi:hypothetical protein
MARNRVIYQSEALYVGPIETGCQVGGAKTWNQETVSGLTPQQLFRVQDVAHSIDIARTDINEFGRLAAIEREIIDSPTVSLDFTYLLADGKNERTLGFIVNGSVNTVSGVMANRRDEQNYYILTVPEGNDATQTNQYTVNDAQACNGVIGIGNGFISAYSVTAAVGDLPSASVTVNANNILFATGSDGVQNPAVNSVGCKASGTVTIPASSTGNMAVAALRPGDVHLNFGSTDLQMGGAILPGSDSSTGRRDAINIQSFTLDLPIGRTPIQRLGDSYAFAREIDFPVNATMSVSAQLTDIEAGNLTDLICGNNKRDISVIMRNCAVGDTCETSDQSIRFDLKNAELESQNFTSSIGANKTVDLTFVGQVGGPQDTTNGVFITATSAVQGEQRVTYGARSPGSQVDRFHPGVADCNACPGSACREDSC